MSRHYGKKLGTLEVKLDRMKTRYQRASVNVELRHDISKGTFWAQYEGNWYSADTQSALSEQIKIAATKALSIEWKRYIQIEYRAEGWPLADKRSGRPLTSGQYHSFEINEARSKQVRSRAEDEQYVICAVSLHWKICEISEPYALPEDPNKRVRARRSVDVERWGNDRNGIGEEKIGDPEEWGDDVLPIATLLWTPEREAVLAEVVAALGKLDARLVDLFSGDVKQLGGKIDAAAQTDPSRLLTAPEAPKKRRGA